MAWEWSHTAEAYTDAYTNVQKLDMITLAEVLAEWLVSAAPGINHLQSKIEAALLTDEYNDCENLAESVWQFASSYDFGRRCDNGGFNAWVCPHGCHTVPFDRMEDDNG